MKFSGIKPGSLSWKTKEKRPESWNFTFCNSSHNWYALAKDKFPALVGNTFSNLWSANQEHYHCTKLAILVLNEKYYFESTQLN